MITPNAPVQFSGVFTKLREANAARKHAWRAAEQNANNYYQALDGFYQATLKGVEVGNKRTTKGGSLYEPVETVTAPVTIGGKPWQAEVIQTGAGLHRKVTDVNLKGPEPEALHWHIDDLKRSDAQYVDPEGQKHTQPAGNSGVVDLPKSKAISAMMRDLAKQVLYAREAR